MKRAVGYCINVGGAAERDSGCEDYAKGVFLLNCGEEFYCPRCRQPGFIVHERGIVRRNNGDPFKEVKVEFNYDPVGTRFREIAIVRDEAIWGRGSQYTLMSPLIKTEQRALKVAEAILANLQRVGTDSSDGIPSTTETIISFDVKVDEFARQMAKLGEEWEKSSLAGNGNGQ
jgi:hypothetical protein